MALGAIAGFALLLAQPASAATQFGQTFDPPHSCLFGHTFLQTYTGQPNPYAAPSAGVITSWTHQASASPPSSMKLKVGRSVGGDQFTIVGESGPVILQPGMPNTFPIRIPVLAGDVLGMYVPDPNSSHLWCQSNPTGPPGHHERDGDTPPGGPYAFQGTSGTRLDVSAVLEPDADGDGFGDETQDQCPTDPAIQGDCAAPDTAITGGPADKTRDKTPTFSFASSEEGSTFQCAVDGQALKVPCTSPYTVTVKRGKHSFQVQATDQAGNADSTPATDSWKVKKRKKR